jgi:hypothetical protein
MTTDEENELICLKLLGWRRRDPAECRGKWQIHPDRFYDMPNTTPIFTTWADAGLILDALRGKGMVVHFFSEMNKFHVETFARDSESSRIGLFDADASTGPLAIRSAALEYIRSLP